MEINMWAFPAAALIPLVIGSIWYNPKVFGAAWLKASGLTDEQARGGNMALIFGLSYVFALLLSLALFGMVVHQGAVKSMFYSEPGFAEAGSETHTYFTEFMDRFGDKHRTFGHGALHGGFGGFLLAVPIIGTIALFERKSFRYIAVNAGYWVVTMILMGGFLCQFA